MLLKVTRLKLCVCCFPRRWLNDNELTGTLPPGWGAEGALKNLTWL